MAIEILDKGACIAMGFASTDQAAPGVQAQGVAAADYTGANGTVLLTLDQNIPPVGQNLVCLGGQLGAFGVATFAFTPSPPNQIQIATFDAQNPPALFPFAGWFMIFVLDLPTVTQVGP